MKDKSEKEYLSSYYSKVIQLSNWKQQDQPWRREPEIDEKRQKELEACLASQSEVKQEVYPFKNMHLTRADVEWLLATHEKRRGSIDWNDKSQRERKGLDLRGAVLQGVDLSDLPLGGMQGGLPPNFEAIPEQRIEATVNLVEADLRGTHLEGAELCGACLSRASLRWAHLEGADLQEASLEETDLQEAHLEGANLFAADLKQANLSQAHLEGANLFAADLKQANLSQAHLEGADLRQAKLNNVTLMGANLSETNLERANLSGVCLQEARMNLGTRLANVLFDDRAQLGDVLWNGVPLAQIDWQQIPVLGDEIGLVRAKDRAEYIQRAHNAIRANRQLAAVLRDQGIDEHADRFAYRAYVLQQRLSRREGKLAQYLFSLLLDIVIGYGYKPGRSIVAYLVSIALFAVIYYVLGQMGGPHFSPFGAAIFSIASFHGRGFFLSNATLDSPITAIAAFEALVGLIIEIGFLLAFVQRLLAK